MGILLICDACVGGLLRHAGGVLRQELPTSSMFLLYVSVQGLAKTGLVVYFSVLY